MIKLRPEEKEMIKAASEFITLNPATLGRMLLIERAREIIKQNNLEGNTQ